MIGNQTCDQIRLAGFGQRCGQTFQQVITCRIASLPVKGLELTDIHEKRRPFTGVPALAQFLEELGKCLLKTSDIVDTRDGIMAGLPPKHAVAVAQAQLRAQKVDAEADELHADFQIIVFRSIQHESPRQPPRDQQRPRHHAADATAAQELGRDGIFLMVGLHVPHHVAPACVEGVEEFRHDARGELLQLRRFRLDGILFREKTAVEIPLGTQLKEIDMLRMKESQRLLQKRADGLLRVILIPRQRHRIVQPVNALREHISAILLFDRGQRTTGCDLKFTIC